MIIKLLENTITGPILYRIFSFILILLILFWVIWGVKISKKENLPSVLPEIEEKKKSYAKIDFDHANSTACLINTNRKELENKLCILLYRIAVIGEGDKSFYIKNISLDVNYNEHWVKGERIYPTQRETTDEEDITKKSIQLNIVKKYTIDKIFIASWIDFKPQEKGLEYGEPKSFSYSAVFDIKENYAECSKLRITINDYLGNKFQETVDISKYTKKTANILLIQD